MKCPLCHAELRIAERQGIEIDYCPACRGVWLDRGELDKMIAQASPMPPNARSGALASYDDDSDASPRGQSRYEGSNRQQPPRKKRGSFLSELFDFG